MIVSDLKINSTITVLSNVKIGRARNMAGTIVDAVPGITLTAEFKGKWRNSEKRDSELAGCIEKLLEAYRAGMSGEYQSGDDGNRQRQ